MFHGIDCSRISRPVGRVIILGTYSQYVAFYNQQVYLAYLLSSSILVIVVSNFSLPLSLTSLSGLFVKQL